jgi:chemotaxis regulatin CheY-phosphate phosphatase CheZ
MIDFSSVFRPHHTLQNVNDLTRWDRQLLDTLRRLDSKELAQNTSGFLTKDEVPAVMARRDKIAALFNVLVAQKGEKEVLY